MRARTTQQRGEGRAGLSARMRAMDGRPDVVRVLDPIRSFALVRELPNDLFSRTARPGVCPARPRCVRGYAPRALKREDNVRIPRTERASGGHASANGEHYPDKALGQ